MFNVGDIYAFLFVGTLLLVVGTNRLDAGVDPQACCLTAGGCVDIPPENCNGTPQGSGTLCSGTMCPTVPAVGTWGLIIVAGIMLIVGTCVVRKRSGHLGAMAAAVVVTSLIGLFLPAPAAAQSVYFSSAKIQDRERDGTRQIFVNPFGPRIPLYHQPHPRFGNERRAKAARMTMDRLSDNVSAPAVAQECVDHSVEGMSPYALACASVDERGGREGARTTPPAVAMSSPAMGEIQILGLQIQYGTFGTVPVRLESKLAEDASFVPRFGGENLAVGGVEQVNLGMSKTTLTLKVKAAFDPYNSDGDNNHWTNPLFYKEVMSDETNSIILIDGDNINDIIAQKGIQTPFGSQVPISQLLQSYVDANGNIYLDNNRILLLAELGTNPSNCSNSPSCDFQDAVLVLDLDGIVQAPDVYIAEAIGSPHTGWPKEDFLWSMVKSAPGTSQTRGLAYAKWYEQPRDNTIEGSDSIHACILNGAGLSWNDCNPVEVFRRPFPLGRVVRMADFAMTGFGVHAIGWIERNSGTGLLQYYVAFTQDNGLTWQTPVLLGSFVSIPGQGWHPFDIDLAANDAGDIAVLTYFKQTGTSPAPNPTEPNTLVLFVFPLGNTTSPISVPIAPASGAVAVYNNQCFGTCFGLTGDVGHTFHAFYYTGASPTYSARASTVVNEFVTDQRLVVSNNSLSTLAAARTSIGAATFVTSGNAFGTYDVPTTGATALRPGSQFISLPGAEIDDGPFSTSVRVTWTHFGVGLWLPGNFQNVYVTKATQGGFSSGTISINDVSPFPWCGGDGGQSPYIGPNCYNYQVPKCNGAGGVVIGDIYYTSALLTEYAWNGVDSYLTDNTYKQHLVVLQTTAEP